MRMGAIVAVTCEICGDIILTNRINKRHCEICQRKLDTSISKENRRLVDNWNPEIEMPKELKIIKNDNQRFKAYHENGQLHFSNRIKRGKVHGSYKNYYPNGKLRSIDHYKKGNKVGTWKRFYESGQLEEVLQFKKGESHGKWEQYYENGTLKRHGSYKKNQKDGEWTEYDNKGKLKKVKMYKDGKLSK
jgi:antitoxin component YwqK of YwqJK toxin-antitoxin module